MLILTGQVMKVFEVPSRTNRETGEVIPASSKVQIMGDVPVQGGETRLELYDLKTDRGPAFRAAVGKRVRCPVQVYSFDGNAGLYMVKTGEIELVNECGEKTGLLDGGRKAA